MTTYANASDAMRMIGSASKAVALVMRSMPHNPERDALSVALSDLVIAQACCESIKSKLSVTPKPTFSPTAGG